MKRAASRAHQAGQNRVVGVAGESGGVLRLDGAGDASAEQLLAWGANQLVFPAGLPAGQNGNYLARASWFNGQGQPVRDILLLESRLGEPTRAVVDALLTLQRDFDLADAETLGRQATQAKPSRTSPRRRFNWARRVIARF